MAQHVRAPLAQHAQASDGSQLLAWHALDEDCILFHGTLTQSSIKGAHGVLDTFHQARNWLHANPAACAEDIEAKRLGLRIALIAGRRCGRLARL